MKVIKLEKNKKSEKGKIVKVKKGYARNYLVKKGKAIIANKKNTKYLNEKRKKLITEYKKYTNKIKNKLKNVKIEVLCKTGQAGKIFGSIGRRYLSKKLDENYGIKIKTNQINIKKTRIKEIGEYKIKLYEKIKLKLKLKKINK